jgi:hypothetical protein
MSSLSIAKGSGLQWSNQLAQNSNGSRWDNLLKLPLSQQPNLPAPIQLVMSLAAKHSKMTNLITCECLNSPCSLQAPPFQQEQHSSSMTVLARSLTAASSKAAPVLFDQLDKALKGEEGKELVAKTKVGACCCRSGRQCQQNTLL